MTNTDIMGGVSPLKAYKGRRGKSSGKGRKGTGDTRYKRDKWKKPTSGGTTTPAAKPPNPKKPYTMAPDGKVTMTPPGDVNITEGDNIINQTSGGGYDTKTTTTPGTEGTEDKYEDRTTMTTYQQAWDGKNFKTEDGKRKDIYGNVYSDDAEGFQKFKQATDAYNKKHGTTTKKTERVLVEKGQEGTKGSTTTEKVFVAGPNQEANINDYGHSVTRMLGSPGKYRLGGYRAMKKNKKQ